MWRVLKTLAIRASFYPTLLLNRSMCWLGFWRRWDWVDDALLLGALPARGDIARLRALGVTGIVNLCAEFPGHVEAMRAAGIEQLHLKTLDYHAPSDADMLRGVEFIEQHAAGGGKVYTHCKAGRGRSATLAVCYLMHARRIGAAEAYEIVRAARPHVNRGLTRRAAVRAVEKRVLAGR